MMNSTAQSKLKPSSGYGFSLCAGAVGLPFMGIGLGGALIGQSGGDPVRAFDVDGMVMFLLAFAIGFAVRLIFWPPAPASLRWFVRSFVSAAFVLGGLAALAGLVFSLQLPAAVPHKIVPVCFSILALLCQPGSLIWLTRYRKEGLWSATPEERPSAAG